MSHQIIIILDAVECLQGANVTGAGTLEELKNQAVTNDAWLAAHPTGPHSSEEEIEAHTAVHEWLENLQTSLVSACSQLTALSTNCPNP
jgi:hypothetical protein